MKRGEAKVGFCLAAARWEEQKIDNITVIAAGLCDGLQVHQHKGQLERAPLRIYFA